MEIGLNSDALLAALAPTLTDPDARATFLADPRATLRVAGLDFPDWVTVTAREGGTPELSLVLPPLLDVDGDLSEEQLAVVSGGCSSCQVCGPDSPW